MVNLLLRNNPHAALARRGVGRLPLHYAIFADTPSLEVRNINTFPRAHNCIDKQNLTLLQLERQTVDRSAAGGGTGVRAGHGRVRPSGLALRRRQTHAKPRRGGLSVGCLSGR